MVSKPGSQPGSNHKLKREREMTDNFKPVALLESPVEMARRETRGKLPAGRARLIIGQHGKSFACRFTSLIGVPTDWKRYTPDAAGLKVASETATKLIREIETGTDSMRMAVKDDGYAEIGKDSQRVRVTCLKAFRREISKRTKVSSFGHAAEKMLEEIADEVSLACRDVEAGFEIVSGAELRETYRVGPRSCMSGSNSKKVALWAENPNVVSVLKFEQDGKVVGRCLLWSVDGKVYHDIVYCSSSIGRLAFDRYFDAKGIPDADEYDLTITLDLPADGLFPYADSFRYVIEKSEDTITISTEDDRHIDKLCCVEGGTECEGPVAGCQCSDCGELFDEDELHPVSEWGGDVVCENCLDYKYVYDEFRECFVHVDDVIHCSDGTYADLSSVFGLCEDCGCGMRDEDDANLVIGGRQGDYHVCDECAEDHSHCVECGNFYDSEECACDCGSEKGGVNAGKQESVQRD